MATSVKIPVSKLLLNNGQIKDVPKNPRLIKDAKFDKLKQSIQDDPEMLSLRELLVYPYNEKYVVLGGNMRLRACKELGYTEIECKVIPEDTPAKKLRAIVQKDNIAYGENSWDDIANEWDAAELEEWGLDTPDTWGEDKEIEEDEAPEVDESEPPKSKLGEIYQLGRHRVMCGDSTDKASVELLMDGAKADIGFTSPPYNAGDNVRGKFYANDDDNKTNDDYTIFLTDTSMITLDYCDYSFVNLQILNGNKLSLIDFQTNMRDCIKDILVWNKSIAPPHINKGTFATKWEYIFAFSKQSKSRAFPASWQGKYPNVIETENNSGNKFAKEHKAGFPVALPLWIINKMDFANVVLDIFIGTGTTLIACEQTDRTCYGMELDPKYTDVIRKRWAKYVYGDEALENDKWIELTPVVA